MADSGRALCECRYWVVQKLAPVHRVGDESWLDLATEAIRSLQCPNSSSSIAESVWRSLRLVSSFGSMMSCRWRAFDRHPTQIFNGGRMNRGQSIKA